jgi:nucleoside-triphosphatase
MKSPRGLDTAARLVVNFSDYNLKTRLASKLAASYGRWLAGFRTFELRSGGSREGFEIEALSGGRAVLASKSLHSPVSFNKYGVSLAALEETALRALESAGAGKILLFDELGPMAMLSERFSARAVELLFSDRRCLVFCRKGAAVFDGAFSKMSDTVIIELEPGSWAEAVAATQAWLDRLVEGMEKI